MSYEMKNRFLSNQIFRIKIKREEKSLENYEIYGVFETAGDPELLQLSGRF